MKKMLFLLTFVVCGCSSMFPQVKYLYNGPYGPVYEAYCHGSFKSLGDCYQQAGQTCNGYFQIMNQSEKNDKNFSYDISGGSGTSSTADWDKFAKIRRSVIFYCTR